MFSFLILLVIIGLIVFVIYDTKIEKGKINK